MKEFFLIFTLVFFGGFYAKPLNAGKRPDFIWGINGHPLTQQAYTDDNINKQIANVKSLGLSYYRVDVPTDSSGNILNHQKFIDLIKASTIYNVKILPVFYLTSLNLKDEPEIAFYKGENLGRNVILKYGQYFDYWELGNEEDVKTMYPNTDGNRIEQYDAAKARTTVEFLRGMCLGIKKQKPKAKVIINFAGWLHYGFLELLKNAKVSYDIIGLHWYSEMGDLTNIRERHINILGTLKTNFKKPVWITEINRRNGTMGDRLNEGVIFINKYINEAYNDYNVKAFFVYELYNEPVFKNNESYYGIINRNGTTGGYLSTPIGRAFMQQIKIRNK